MWHRRRGRVGLNIFLTVLIVAVVYFMFIGYRQMSALQAEQDKALVALANETKQQTQASKEESYEALEAAYQQDLDAVSQYLPGIVCWGDVLTEGTASGISYPKSLQSLIDKYLVTPYDFRSTLENPYQYTRMDWDKYTVSIPVVNMGIGKESTQTILGRSGVVPFTVSKEFVIPADCSPVQLYFNGYKESAVKPLISGDMGVNPVTICGVEGILTADPDSYSDYSTGSYTFTRSVPGAEVTVERGTEIVTSSSSLYRDYIHIIFIGSYGTYSNAEELAAQVKLMVSRQTKNSDRFLVIGNYAGSTSSSNFYNQFAALMTQEYGERFLNFRKYLLNEALSEFDMNPTREDTSYVKGGYIPPSVLVAGSEPELRSFLYEKLGQLVFERLDALGYFDEVRAELHIPSVSAVDAALAAAKANQ